MFVAGGFCVRRGFLQHVRFRVKLPTCPVLGLVVVKIKTSGPQPLVAPDPPAAALIGRPTRQFAVNTSWSHRGNKQKHAVETVYIHAETQIALPRCDVMESPTALQIAYAHRRAINAAIVDLFGDISGASVLAYDLLKCTQMEVNNETEKDKTFGRRFELLVALQRAHADEMIAALSMITAGFCGGEILSLFVPSKASAETKVSAGLVVDVLGVADSPTTLISAS
uniref:Acyl-CoA N-acyltransferase n=1 Tax=Mesocestoides corti TaxID=53468 RepID=A0A5K3EXY0_MESCO